MLGRPGYNIDLNVLMDVSHTPKDSYILERLRVHLTHIVWRYYLSLDNIGAVYLWNVLCLGCSGVMCDTLG